LLSSLHGADCSGHYSPSPCGVCLLWGDCRRWPRTGGKICSLESAVAAAGGFLLDFDGVLADSEPYYHRSYSEALRPIGLHVDPEEYWIHWTSRGEGLDGFLGRHAIQGVDADALRARQKAIYSGYCAEGLIPLFPFAADLLEALSRDGRPFAIASNTDRVLVESILAKAGAGCAWVIGGEGLPPKPSPAIFLKAAEALGLRPPCALVFEDAEKGLRAARAGGFPSVLVRGALNGALALEADCEIDGLQPFLAILNREDQ
jgi:HAD superfamily hydrolase (TIGR01509 family)